MTLYGALRPRSDIHRLYLPREKGGRGLISCEGCIRTEENSLKRYVKNSVEPLLQQVAKTGVIETERCETKENFKKKAVEELEKAWIDKKMYGQYNRDLDRTVESPFCRVCGENGEHITHLISECKKLAQKEYKRRRNNVARIVHWKLCGLYQLEKAENVVLKKEKECKIIDIAVPGDCKIGIKETEK
ncbi:Hypothetical predicted protein, partial [Paramuricea clavata]